MMGEVGSKTQELTAEFMVEISLAIKKYFPLFTEEVGFAAGHIILGALEQAQQKVLEEINELLFQSAIRVR